MPRRAVSRRVKRYNMTMTDEIIFLKLGGSLITDKDTPYPPRIDKLNELALEIKTALD